LLLHYNKTIFKMQLHFFKNDNGDYLAFFVLKTLYKLTNHDIINE
jgi:hypothetical protein